MKRLALILMLAALLIIAMGWAVIPDAHPATVAATRGNAPQQISPTPTRWCPTLTPEPFWVDSVTSPTDLLAQTVVVRIGNTLSQSLAHRSALRRWLRYRPIRPVVQEAMRLARVEAPDLAASARVLCEEMTTAHVTRPGLA